MANTRNINTTVKSSKDTQRSIAATIMRLEFEKKAKLEPAERFKLMMKMRMDAARQQHRENKVAGRPMSMKAEKALRDIAKRKELKDAKKLRQMVIISPQRYTNGNLNKKGKIYDIAGNVIGTVNKKNGKISVGGAGASLGKYKAKSHFVNMQITNAINVHSPYFINLRKMQALQAAGLDPLTGQPLHQQTLNVHGASSHEAAMHGGGYTPPSQSAPVGVDNAYTDSAGGPRQNIGVTAWGAQSDNVWGTYSDNVWGTSTDNVWGGNSSDIWGGIGGNPYGGKSVQFWNTGSGTNYIKGLTNFLRKMLGRPSKTTIKQVNAYRAGRGNGSGSGGSSTRTARSTSTSTTRSGK